MRGVGGGRSNVAWEDGVRRGIPYWQELRRRAQRQMWRHVNSARVLVGKRNEKGDFGLTFGQCYNNCNNMQKETKVRKIGNSLGIVLPKAVLHAMEVEEGATLYITGDAEGAVRLTPERPGFKEKMAVAELGMQRYRNALKELAK